MSEKIIKAVEIARDVQPTAIPIAYVGMTICGVPLPDIVSGVTLVYLVIQIGYVINKWYRGK